MRLDALPAGCFVEIEHALDVGFENLLERPLDRHAAEMDDRVAIRRRAHRRPGGRRDRTERVPREAPHRPASTPGKSEMRTCRANSATRCRIARPIPPAAPVSRRRSNRAASPVDGVLFCCSIELCLLKAVVARDYPARISLYVVISPHDAYHHLPTDLSMCVKPTPTRTP